MRHGPDQIFYFVVFPSDKWRAAVEVKFATLRDYQRTRTGKKRDENGSMRNSIPSVFVRDRSGRGRTRRLRLMDIISRIPSRWNELSRDRHRQDVGIIRIRNCKKEIFGGWRRKSRLCPRVFMRTGMREIPNAYGAPPARIFSRERRLIQWIVERMFFVLL